jgi:hypothetical protein
MAVVVTNEHMAVGDWSADVDYTPALRAELVDDEKRPRKLHVLVYDPDGDHIYTGVLLRVDGDELGLKIGGRGLLWWPGAGDDGPMIALREYVSGANKLSNGDFALGGLYWQRPSQGSLWVFTTGAATNPGGLAADDVLAFDLKLPTKPGNTYNAHAVLTGTGRLRVRTLYEGRFNPPNLMSDPNYATPLAWTNGPNLAIVAGQGVGGLAAMRIQPIPKPQLISNADFASGAGWTLGPTMTISGGALHADPNPKPQLVTNPSFASGTGWTVPSDITIVNDPTNAFAGASWVMALAPNPYPQYIIHPDFGVGASALWTPPATADVGFYNDASKAHSGTWSIRVGVIVQKQLVINPTFEVTGHWYQNNDVPTDPSTDWYYDAGMGMEGSQAFTTQGFAGMPNQKFLRAQFDNTAGITPAVVVPGEDYELEGWVWAAPSTDGRIFMYGHIPHATVPNHERWFPTQTLDGSQISVTPAQWKRISTTISIPPARVSLNLGVTVLDHHAGYWHIDNVTLTRIRGNRARMDSVSPYAVVANNAYRLSAYVRSGDGHTGGSTRVGVILTGAGMTPQTHDVDQPHTDYVWTQPRVDFTPTTGYTDAKPFIMGVDVVGDSMYLDDMYLEKVSNNSAEATGTTITLTPNQRYLLSVPLRSGPLVTRGTVTVGVRLNGAGMAEQTVSANQGDTKNKWQSLSVSVQPPLGYTTATPFVRSTDIEGDNFYVGRFDLIKADNNTDVTTHSSFAVVPSQAYLLAAAVNSSAAATNGTVTVGVTLSGASLPDLDQIVAQGLTQGTQKAITVAVTPPVGYTSAVPFVRSKDIEGGTFDVDNVTLTKLDNNTDFTQSDVRVLTPERSYRFEAPVRSGTNLQRGTVKLSAVCQRAGHPNIIFESSAMAATLNAWKTLSFNFTPPSGYNAMLPEIVGTDVEGDNWYVSTIDLRDTDTATVVFDTTADSPTAATITNASTAPAGAQTVRVEIVAEEGTSAMTVDNVSLARTGVTPATGNAIVAQLLTDPTTSLPLSIVGGTVNCPEVIPYDWTLVNLTDRAALDHYCTVVSDPPREYRVNPDRTIDVGTAETVFTDHTIDGTSPVVLLATDIDVDPLPAVSADSELRATEVQVIGAEMATVSGGTVLITATAQVPGTPEVDWNGNTIRRTRPVSDGTVDHIGYAQALAADLAEKEATPALSVAVKLSVLSTATAIALGFNPRPVVKAGEWLYVYHPQAGLSDPDNATTIEGRTVYPRRVRAFTDQRTLGPGCSIVVRREDGTTFPLPGVNWSDADTLTLVVGDRRPNWQADPQGGPTGLQYERDRKSKPR